MFTRAVPGAFVSIDDRARSVDPCNVTGWRREDDQLWRELQTHMFAIRAACFVRLADNGRLICGWDQHVPNAIQLRPVTWCVNETF